MNSNLNIGNTYSDALNDIDPDLNLWNEILPSLENTDVNSFYSNIESYNAHLLDNPEKNYFVSR